MASSKKFFDPSEYETSEFIGRWKQPSKAKVQTLAISINDIGQQQPVLFRKTKDGKLVLEFGFTRDRAIKALRKGFKVQTGGTKKNPEYTEYHKPDMKIWAVVRKYDEKAAFMAKIDENAARNPLSPMDIAVCHKKLKALGFTGADIARKWGKTEAWVSILGKLLNLPAVLQEAVHNKEMSYTAAVDIQRSKLTEGEQVHLYKKLKGMAKKNKEGIARITGSAVTSALRDFVSGKWDQKGEDKGKPSEEPKADDKPSSPIKIELTDDKGQKLEGGKPEAPKKKPSKRNQAEQEAQAKGFRPTSQRGGSVSITVGMHKYGKGAQRDVAEIKKGIKAARASVNGKPIPTAIDRTLIGILAWVEGAVDNPEPNTCGFLRGLLNRLYVASPKGIERVDNDNNLIYSQVEEEVPEEPVVKVEVDTADSNPPESEAPEEKKESVPPEERYCPECGAEPFEPCRENGKNIATFHASRMAEE